ncbi:MAG: hypothetical protein NT178_01120 [Proteobacteria bacterium]|nr:hypothetical protein [Pseudomonadota bacterium]
MSAQIGEVTCPCMMTGIEECRQLVFPDGGQIRVKGLDRIFEIAYWEGKMPDNSVAYELIEQLSKENYIPSSEQARLEYTTVVLREYRKFFEKKEQNKAVQPPK